MALLNHDDLNVISVDWMLGASPPYSQAVANTRLVGAMIAHLIKIIQVDFFHEKNSKIPMIFLLIILLHYRKAIQINFPATEFILLVIVLVHMLPVILVKLLLI